MQCTYQIPIMSSVLLLLFEHVHRATPKEDRVRKERTCASCQRSGLPIKSGVNCFPCASELGKSSPYDGVGAKERGGCPTPFCAVIVIGRDAKIPLSVGVDDAKPAATIFSSTKYCTYIW
jgi:hypothetical protein